MSSSHSIGVGPSVNSPTASSSRAHFHLSLGSRIFFSCPHLNPLKSSNPVGAKWRPQVITVAENHSLTTEHTPNLIFRLFTSQIAELFFFFASSVATIREVLFTFSAPFSPWGATRAAAQRLRAMFRKPCIWWDAHSQLSSASSRFTRTEIGSYSACDFNSFPTGSKIG